MIDVHYSDSLYSAVQGVENHRYAQELEAEMAQYRPACLRKTHKLQMFIIDEWTMVDENAELELIIEEFETKVEEGHSDIRVVSSDNVVQIFA